MYVKSLGSMRKKTVLTIGMGAVGSLYTSWISSELTECHCITRSETDLIQKKAITIRNPDGTQTKFNPDFVYNSIQELNIKPDFIIIATKVLPSINLIPELKKVVGDKTVIVLIQNGINIEEPYNIAFPNTEIISGLAFVCVSKLAPASIHHQDYGRLIIGKYPQGNSANVDLLVRLFNQHQLCAKSSSFIIQDRYKKLLWNASFNPLSVIHGGLNTKELLDIPNMKDTVKNIMKEVWQVASSNGCNLSLDDIKKNISDTYKMTPYKTSMCLDWEKNKPLEKEAILGNLIPIAANANIEIPYIKKLYQQLNNM